jgi:hypothetical protein
MGTAKACPEVGPRHSTTDLLNSRTAFSVANDKWTYYRDLGKWRPFVEIVKATGWQNHSIRGFISGTLNKKIGLKVESEKTDAGDRAYRIAQ